MGIQITQDCLGPSLYDKFVSTIETMRDLVNLSGDVPNYVYVSGYHEKDDGAFSGYIFEWDPTSTEHHNGGTIIELGAPFPTDWNDQTQLDAWFNYNGGTTGRYKLKYKENFVKPEWFGAKGDGITDDTVSLNQCLKLPEPEILLTKTYLIKELDIDLSAGDSTRKTISGGKITTDNTATYIFKLTDDVNNYNTASIPFKFKNIEFEGNENTAIPIILNGVFLVDFEKCEFKNFDAHITKATAESGRVRFYSNVFFNCRGALISDSGIRVADIHYINNYSYRMKQDDLMFVYHLDGLVFTNNTCFGGSPTAKYQKRFIVVNYQADNITIADNKFFDSYDDAVVLYRITSGNIVNNFFSRIGAFVPSGSAIVIVNDSTFNSTYDYVGQTIITNNVITKCTGTAITVLNLMMGIISDNEIFEAGYIWDSTIQNQTQPTYNGISVIDCQNVVVKGNVITEKRDPSTAIVMKYGIYIAGTNTSDVKAFNNNIYGSYGTSEIDAHRGDNVGWETYDNNTFFIEYQLSDITINSNNSTSILISDSRIKSNRIVECIFYPSTPISYLIHTVTFGNEYVRVYLYNPTNHNQTVNGKLLLKISI